MEYKLNNPIISKNYIEELFKLCYNINPYELLTPTQDFLEEPTNLDNIDDGSKLLIDTLNKPDSRIVFIVDPDVDGFTSSAILWLYIKKLWPEANLEYQVHSGKQHGLEDMVDELEIRSEDISLIILPDSSSNDEEYHIRLNNVRIPILVLDHHEANEYSQSAVVINNQLSQNYNNKALTGAGVVYQFCRYLDRILHQNLADDFIDLAALGIISDMGSVGEKENAYIIKRGLNKPLKNFLFQTFLDKQAYSIGDKINSVSIAFYVTPLINALIRVGTMQEKENLFLAFIDGQREVPSTKRGEKGLTEKIATQIVRHCTNARNHQNKALEAAMESLEFRIKDQALDQNELLVIELDEEDNLPSTLNGLLAMKLASKYQRPTLVVRTDDFGIAKGSARGVNNSKLTSLKDYLESTQLFEFCAGHANAFGQGIKKSSIPKLIQTANKELKAYDFGETWYSVNFERKAFDDDIGKIIEDIDKFHAIYGQGCPEPLIAITNIDFTKKDVQIMGKNKDTVKIIVNEIAYMLFHAKNFISELESLETSSYRLKVVGRANMNEWMGNKTPQIFIDDYNLYDNSLLF